MNKILIAAISVLLLSGHCAGQGEGAKDPDKLFYEANRYYEKGDYVKALQAYDQIVSSGIGSGRLYYNIGNAFFKLGKIGYAILYYEKAKTLIPRDGDLKSNLAYARSFIVESAVPEPTPLKLVLKAIQRPFADFNLNAITISAAIFYMIILAILAFFIINPLAVKRLTLVFILFLVLFFLNLGAFAIRYYGEEIEKRGIVAQKETGCKYEPIENSTNFYRLQEGNEVVVLQTRDGWRKVRRPDGKIGWVKKEAVEEI